MKRILQYKFAIIAGLAIILLYFFLRVYNLTILPIFVDEAIYIRWAQVMQAESTLRFLPLSDGKQPLFMWTVIPFLKIFPDPLFAGRMVSVVTGFGTLVGIFLLTLYLFKKPWIALIAALIYAVSPFAVFFDRMALVDSMLSMFGVWILLLGVVTARKLRLDAAMLTGFALGGGLLTKSPALFYSLLLPLTVIFAPVVKRVKVWSINYKNIAKFIGLLSIVYAIGYAMYNILRLGPNFHLIGERNQDYVFPLSHILTNPKDPFIFYIDRIKEWLWMLGPNGLLILFVIGGSLALIRFPRESSILLAWAVVPILVLAEFAKVITARYILFSLPPLIVLASLPFLFKNRFLNPITKVALLLLFVVHALVIDYRLITDPEKAPLPQSERSGYLEEWTAGTGIREVAEFIRSEYQKEPNVKIVIGTEGFFGALPDGLQMYLSNYPEITIIGTGLSFKEVPTSLVESKVFGNKTYLVVNSSRFNEKFKVNDPNELGLALIASYPKAKRARTDTHEYIWYGERDYLYLFEVTEDAIFPKSRT